MIERIEKYKFRKQLKKIDWDSIFKAINKTIMSKAGNINEK